MARDKLKDQLALFGALRAASLPPEERRDWEEDLKRLAGWGGGGV